MNWGDLAVGARWPCGHPRTPENTQSNGQITRCKACHRQRSRDRWERQKNERAEFLELTPDSRADELGGEFVAARRRWAVRRKVVTPMDT